MKFIPSESPETAGRLFSFSLTVPEKSALIAVLELYPMVDAAAHKLSRQKKESRPAEQKWLEEAMAEQRVENKKKVNHFFLYDKRFFKPEGDGHRMSLSRPQLDWMLRVLNDVRVGSWMRLGCPEMEAAHKMTITADQANYLAMMELSGYFQSVLLQAFA